MFAPLPPPEQLVPIVGIAATNTLAHLPTSLLWLWYALLRGLLAIGYGVLLLFCSTRWKLWLQGCFSPREHAVGPQGCFFDGVVVWIIDVYTADHPNRFYYSLYHHNCGYSMAENINDAN